MRAHVTCRGGRVRVWNSHCATSLVYLRLWTECLPLVCIFTPVVLGVKLGFLHGETFPCKVSLVHLWFWTDPGCRMKPVALTECMEAVTGLAVAVLSQWPLYPGRAAGEPAVTGHWAPTAAASHSQRHSWSRSPGCLLCAVVLSVEQEHSWYLSHQRLPSPPIDL